MKILCLLLIALQSHAWIPRGMQILNKAVENSGAGLYQIEYEVQIPVGVDTYAIKERWLIENDGTMKVTATGLRELKDQFQWQALYTGGQKYQLTTQGKVNEPLPVSFIERVFHFRNSDSFANYLVQQQIVPSSIFQGSKRALKTLTDISNQTEPFMRLSRTGGSIAFAFGTPSATTASENNPGLWIDQDQFVVRKYRDPRQVEVLADQFQTYSRGLVHPKVRTVKWGSQTWNILTTQVQTKPFSQKEFQASSLDTLSKNTIPQEQLKNLIQEFYSKLR